MKTRFLSRDAIKLIAMLAMLLNHIATVFLPSGTFLCELFTDVGYFTAVTMCYFLVEGYGCTRSKERYAMRLGLFALISEIPYCLMLTEGGVLQFSGMNMMFTLLIYFGILYSLENIAAPALKALAVLGLTLLSVISDWALLAPAFTLLFAWANGAPRKTAAAFAISAALFGLFSFAGGIDRFPAGTNLLYSLGCAAGIVLAGIAIVCFYNGRRAARGKTFLKWFFYLFYPAHMLILGLLRIALIG